MLNSIFPSALSHQLPLYNSHIFTNIHTLNFPRPLLHLPKAPLSPCLLHPLPTPYLAKPPTYTSARGRKPRQKPKISPKKRQAFRPRLTAQGPNLSLGPLHQLAAACSSTPGPSSLAQRQKDKTKQAQASQPTLASSPGSLSSARLPAQGPHLSPGTLHRHPASSASKRNCLPPACSTNINIQEEAPLSASRGTTSHGRLPGSTLRGGRGS